VGVLKAQTVQILCFLVLPQPVAAVEMVIVNTLVFLVVRAAAVTVLMQALAAQVVQEHQAKVMLAVVQHQRLQQIKM
jgi:hypothetical protein